MAFNEQKRLFVGNLPPDIQEHDVKSEFSYYGKVDRVEIKHKKSPDSDQVQSTFAFITIAIDDRGLGQCLQEFKEQQFRGRYLQVTVARENFLEKLKREREEAAQQKEKKEETNKTEISTITARAALPTISTGDSSTSESSSEGSDDDDIPNDVKPVVAKINGSKKFKSSSESSSESDNGDNLVLKKKSKIFIENGKIKIDRTVSSGEAIHIINSKAQKTNNNKQLDEKSKQADQKRIESLNKMKNSYNEQKLAIKKALAGVDTSQKSNKIVFGDDDEEEGDNATFTSQVVKSTPQSKSKENQNSAKMQKLFDEEDSNDEQDYGGNFGIKQQFEGKKGEKLRRLQDRFHGDSRFKMDSKFLEDDSDGSDAERKTQKLPPKGIEKSSEDIETNETDERQWQLNILESVIGKKVKSNTAKETQKKAPPSMLRFDPTRAEHTKFVEPKVKKRKAKVNAEPDAKRLKTDSDHEEDLEKNEVPVSMEHFYEVRGDLKKSLGSSGFSLLSMFNRPSDNADATSTAEKPYEERTIAKNGVKFLADFDPFKYDSSGDEADDSKGKSKGPKIENDGKKLDIKFESFFMLNSSDERVAEGLALFKPPEKAENEEANANDYDDAQRQELKNIVKRKIKKSLQNALPRNAKPNKRFKRFAKNL